MPKCLAMNEENTELAECSVCHGYFEMFGEWGIVPHLVNFHPESMPAQVIELASAEPPRDFSLIDGEDSP